MTDYFFLDRENIHVHINKDIFTTDETVWFKGYVFNRKKNTPSFSSVNIFASLLDQNGQLLKTKLFCANMGSFEGSFKLDDNLISGRYYIQFYTNWMNNFLENESAVYEISIINSQTPPVIDSKDSSKITIDINPEGGILLDDISSTIGLHIFSCNNRSLTIPFAEIVDSSGKTIQTTAINPYGYGKFNLPVSLTQKCKVFVTIDGVKYEKPLPLPVLKGISLNVNNYAVPGKTILTIKTNKNSYEEYIDGLYLLIHKDDSASVLTITLNVNSLEQTIILPNSDFSDGMNTVRILDSELKQIAERLFYNYGKNNLTSQIYKEKESADSQEYSGTTNHPKVNLSVSILPQDTKSLLNNNDIYSSFLLLPYIETEDKIEGRDYFTSMTRSKQYELDLMLLNQKSKYNWNNIINNPPSAKYTFDQGLTVKGTVPANIDTASSKIRLYSLTTGLDEITEVNNKNEFTFNNIIYANSAFVNFTLLRKDKKPLELTISPHVFNNNKKFNKPYKPVIHECAEISTAYENIKYNNSTELKELVIEGSALKYAKMHGNKGLYAYKMSQMKPYLYQNVLRFIDNYGGFTVSEDPSAGIRITAGRNKEMYVPLKQYSLKKDVPGSGCIVYLNNVELQNFEILSSIEMSQVDEIYMFDDYTRGSKKGIIKIYLYKGINPYYKNNTPNITLNDGFEKIIPFEEAENHDAFDNFNIIDWKPKIMTDENGEFTFLSSIPFPKKIKIIIEGFSEDGQLISEEKNL